MKINHNTNSVEQTDKVQSKNEPKKASFFGHTFGASKNQAFKKDMPDRVQDFKDQNNAQ